MAIDAGPQLGDPMLERLERLAARQARATSSRTLPPPVPGQAPTSPPTSPPPPTGRSRRRHPARGARLGALVASCATTGGLTFFFAGTDPSQASPQVSALVAPISSAATPTIPTTPSTTASGAATASPATTAPPATTAAAPTAVAAFDGDTIQTRYGPVQVQAQVQNGSLVAVAVVQYPDGDGKSVRINQRALPQLQSEALTAQSAQVDTISGATYTSDAYVTSLQSAIDEARAAGAMTA